MSRIDREQAIAIIDELNVILFFEANEHSREAYKEIRTAIEHLPTAEKTGKWIAMSDTDGVYWTCSECGEEIPRISHYNPQFDLFPRLESINKTNYCPNCGAKME